MSEPRHIAIIMDGNGRWAHARGLPRIAGHRAGMDALRQIVSHANKIGIQYLTLFAFSSENWSRPTSEVEHLLSLLKIFMRRDLLRLHRENVKIRIIGERQHLSDDIVTLLDEAEQLTELNQGLCLIVAFNYGSRNEIIRAVRALTQKILSNQIEPAEITDELFSEQLDTASIPDPDLIIRTSGELRLSNFLLWQAAYSELYFSDLNWPEFTPQAFDDAICFYAKRCRRFGNIVDKSLVNGVAVGIDSD